MIRFARDNLRATQILRNWRLGHGRRLLLSHAYQQKRSRSFTWVFVGCAIGSSFAFYNRIAELETQLKGVPAEEVRKHNSVENGIWVVINGKVYDLTEFLERHPGGADIIRKYAGKNALAIFNKFHAPDFIAKYLKEEECLGPLLGEMEVAKDITEVDDSDAEEYRKNIPPLSEVFRTSDFEHIAKLILSRTAWTYYSGGAEDEISLRENHNAFGRIFFKPRVLVDLEEIDMTTDMLGVPCEAPIYCSATAQAKLGHPDGELSIARGCGKEGIIQMISHSASYPLKDIVAEAIDGQTQWLQLYLANEDDSTNAVNAVKELGLKSIFVTVDSAEFGRREKDMKLRAEILQSASLDGDDDGASDLSAAVKFGADQSVTWKDIEKIQSETPVPVAIKGVQCVEDLVLAAEKGVKAAVLSNHGGRQLDFSRAPIEVLAEAMPVLKEKGLDDKIEIYIDGGVRRGSDVLKCLALGAKGVGLGRVFLYANAAYGEEGVRRAIQLLKEEMRVDMKLLGVSKLSDLGPQHLDLRNIHARDVPSDNVYNTNYEPLTPPKFRNEE